MTHPEGTQQPAPRTGILALVGPGLLVAATGVGAGDLAGAGLAGAKLGVGILWAVVLGAALKWLVTEQIARFQIATGDTAVEGIFTRLGPVVPVLFALFFFAWTWFVSIALIRACVAISSAALAPAIPGAFLSHQAGAITLGTLHSLAALALVLVGGFKLFERVMSACVVLMVVTTLTAAALAGPDITAALRGLFIPAIPSQADGSSGVPWTLALIGGVGGTVTILCYGYWIKEARTTQGLTKPHALRRVRIDLAVGYAFTALFGIAMILIAGNLPADGRGSAFVVNLINAIRTGLEPTLGQTGAAALTWAFLIGAWAAVFSSVLGVWQSVPYLFADAARTTLHRRSRASHTRPEITTRDPLYRGYLVLIAVLPIVGLALALVGLPTTFAAAQLAYGIAGAAFIPLLAAALLILNRKKHTASLANTPFWITLLLLTMTAFAALGIYDRLNP